MIACRKESFNIATTRDLIQVRRHLSEKAETLGMKAMRETELRTAATELMSNMLRYAGGGTISVEEVEHGGKWGLRAVFEDRGPGIENLEAALTKGFSTGTGLGHGLSGCKNLVDAFRLESEPGRGTRVEITKWC